ncbi:MAG TPA: S41 family peptidase [Thermoanaerobaculia bacterium]|nr:S41 family peptidase [Thermoanaerobaculia bacterium]
MSLVQRSSAVLLFGTLLVIAMPGAAAENMAEVRPIPSFSQPAVSPDGSSIVFSAGGDLWSVPRAGGAARLLVAHPAQDSRPLWSPDGRSLAFVSTRTGNGDVYLFTFATGEVRRLTWDDEPEVADAWSRDGTWIYFSSPSHDVSNMNDVYRVRPEGGTPVEVSADRYVNEYFAAPSPDGRTLAMTARGIVSAQWWRHGHSHIDQSEIWLLKDGIYRRAGTGNGEGKEAWPLWSPDGRRLWFMSDRDGAENLWSQEIGESGPGAAAAVTRFTEGRVLWPNISWNGRVIVFERNLGIWQLDTSSGAATEVPITLEGSPAGPGLDRRDVGSSLDELALAPDGKKVAFVAHGEIFAASAEDGGPAARVTRTPAAAEYQVVWAPDSRRLVYVSERDGGHKLWLYDFATGQESPLAAGPGVDDTPGFSPDGKLLAFQRNQRELRVLDLAAGKDRRIAQVLLDNPPLGSHRPFAWSPDGRWIAVLGYGERMFRNVLVVPVEGGEARPASFLAHTNADDLAWSPDGTFLLFATNQRSEPGQLARIDLLPRTPRFREDQFRDLFQPEEPEPEENPGPEEVRKAGKKNQDKPKDQETSKDPEKPEKPAAPSPVEIVVEGLRQRLSLLPVGIDVASLVIAPDGKSVALIGTAAGQSSVWVYPLDELARGPAVARQISSTPGDKGSLQFSPDSKEVWYLDGSSIVATPLGEGEPRTLSVSAEMDVDFGSEKLGIFDQAWRYLRDNFVDPGMHGVDWDAARAQYLPRAMASRTPDELRRLLTLMIGELNASHSGIRNPPAETKRTTGRLAVRFDAAKSEAAGKLLIREVLPQGPAAVTRRIEAGDWLLAVDGRPVDAGTNLDELLDHTIGRQVRLTVADSPGGAGAREVAVRPVDQKTEKGLTYRAWVEANRAYVDRISGGRLGYVHMFDMGDASLAQLLLDLDAQNMTKEGVVVDMRNNNGGYVNAYAIDVLSRRGYMGMTFRGFDLAPARALLGQRALERPTILVVNRHTLSDGEDFTEGYRTLGLGQVVGEPTAGWIIYTSDVDLLDGSQVRLPFIKITGATGEDMEMNPRPVDLHVEQPVGEGLSGKDSQLDEAVRALLATLKSGLPASPASPDTPRTPR